VAGLEPPNKILFIQGLPPATNDSMLGMLFQQFPGDIYLLAQSFVMWLLCHAPELHLILKVFKRICFKPT
jgi:hypothetical protein